MRGLTVLPSVDRLPKRVVCVYITCFILHWMLLILDIGLEEARRKGTNRKVVRTDPRISHNKFEPPWVRVLHLDPYGAPAAEIRHGSHSCEPRV